MTRCYKSIYSGLMYCNIKLSTLYVLNTVKMNERIRIFNMLRGKVRCLPLPSCFVEYPLHPIT